MASQEKHSEMDVDDIMGIFYQICKTAAYLKKQEVVHRDFKPANIMVEKVEGNKLTYSVSVVDFGFAAKQDYIKTEDGELSPLLNFLNQILLI